MIPPNVKAGIFAGESGGDYDALFGYSQRDGGQFAGVRPTQMTVGELLQFQDPSGPYGQWVKGQVGHVATPIGAYQIVGRTLRGAVDAGVVRPDEVFSQDVQDRVGGWIYQTQGTGAWEGYRPNGGGNVQTVSTKSPGLLGQPQEPRGLLGMTPDRLDRLSLALMSLSGSPSLQPLMANVAAGMQDRRDERKTNTTAEIIATRFNRPDLAELVKVGGIDGATALRLATEPPERQGQVLTHIQIKDMFGIDVEPGLYNSKADGTMTKVGGGGTSVTVNNNQPGAPSDEALRKKLMEGEGTVWSEYLAAGSTSAGLRQDMALLDEVIELAPTGPVTGRLAEMFPGASDAGAVFQSVVKRVAPSLRVEGSGSQSDIEYNGFLQSLPALSNRPEANRAISGFLKAKAKVNMDRADAVRAYQNGEIDAPEARRRIAEIDARSIMTPELKALVDGVAQGGSQDGDLPTFNRQTGMWE